MTTTMGPNTLQQLVKESGLEQSKAQVVLSNFSDIFEIAASWEKRASEIQVTSAEDVDAIKQARDGRLILKQKRVDVEKIRKTLKEDSLREGRLIDGISKTLTALIEPIEKDLEAKEKFVEIQAENRRQELSAARSAELRKYDVDPSFYELGSMPDPQWTALLNGSIAARDARIEAEKKAIEERAAKEEEDRKVRAENERLKREAEEREKREREERQRLDREAADRLKEQDERERKIREEEEAKRTAEREEANRKLADERAAREKIEAEAREKARLEEEDRKQKADAERKAKRAPDREKLLNFAKILEDAWGMNYPQLKSEDAVSLLVEVGADMRELLKTLRTGAQEL